MSFNKTLLLAALGSSMFVAGAANADMMSDMKFYAGAGLNYTKFSLDNELKNSLTNLNANLKLEDKKAGAGLFAGVKFHENFGVELGYNFHGKLKLKDAPAGTSGDLKSETIYGDLVGFMPIDDSIDLIGSLGLGRTRVKGNVTPNVDDSTHKTAFRVGAGAAYKFDENWAVRGMIKYQKVGGKFNFAGANVKHIKHQTSGNLDVVFMF